MSGKRPGLSDTASAQPPKGALSFGTRGEQLADIVRRGGFGTRIYEFGRDVVVYHGAERVRPGRYVITAGLDGEIVSFGLESPLTVSDEAVDHPAHYGGADNPYEAIKVIEAWGVGFNLGTVLKYLARAGKKAGEPDVKDLKKCLWYLQREIELRERRHGSGPA